MKDRQTYCWDGIGARETILAEWKLDRPKPTWKLVKNMTDTIEESSDLCHVS